MNKRPRVPKKEMKNIKSTGNLDGAGMIDDLELDFDQIPDYEQTKNPLSDQHPTSTPVMHNNFT